MKSLFMKKRAVNPLANNIFAFWESPNPIPAYLDLCKDTWIKNLPNCEIHILNHANLEQYIGDIYNIKALKTISFAMQSDIISAAVLEKFGGLFLDLDCIVVDDVFKILSSISEEKLISFGRVGAKAIHLAVLFSKKPGNPILSEWRKEAQKRLISKPEKYDWDFFGNAIVNPLLNHERYKNDFYIIDRTASGNILESAVFLESNRNNIIADYKNLYFNENFMLSPKILDLVNCGVISLHNSWTPKIYKDMYFKEAFLESQIPLSGLLNYILKNNTSNKNFHSYPMLEAYLICALQNKGLTVKHRYYKGMLVIDLWSREKNLAFDVSIDRNNIVLDFIARNFSVDLLQDSTMFANSQFNKENKVRVLESSDKTEVLNRIISIYNLVSTKDYDTAKNAPETGNNLKSFTNQKLRINGDYFDDKGNVMKAPKDLDNVHIQFFGNNNTVTIDPKSNLKNTTIEFRGNNSSVVIGVQVGLFGWIRLGHGCSVSIGSRTTSTNNVYITCAEHTNLKIGEDCMFATNNQIRTDDAHTIYDVNTGKRINKAKNITIGNHVWIGYGAMVFGGADIGDGSIVGAFSFVNNQFPNNCIVAGTPAKIIRKDVFWERTWLLTSDQEITHSVDDLMQQVGYVKKTKENN